MFWDQIAIKHKANQCFETIFQYFISSGRKDILGTQRYFFFFQRFFDILFFFWPECYFRYTTILLRILRVLASLLILFLFCIMNLFYFFLLPGRPF